MKEIDIVAKKELRKWLDDGGTIDDFISNKYGEHLEKATSLAIELMEEDFLKKDRKEIANWTKRFKIKIFDNLLIEERNKAKADFRKMIEGEISKCKGYGIRKGKVNTLIVLEELLVKLGTNHSPEDNSKRGSGSYSSGVCICGHEFMLHSLSNKECSRCALCRKFEEEKK